MYNTLAAAIDRSSFSNIENVDIISNNSVEVFCTDEDNQITTAAGNDTIHLGGGNNTANSGAGADHIYVTGSTSTANLGSGDDFVTTSSLGSSIDGGDGNDKLILAPNSFETSLTINLELQTFTSVASSGSLNIVNIEQYEFSETNSITIHGSDAAETFTLLNGPGTIYGNGGGDTFTGSSESDNYIFSEKYNSTLLACIKGFIRGVFFDLQTRRNSKLPYRNLNDILKYRFSQFYGTYKGFNKLIDKNKMTEMYFYPPKL